MAKAFVTSVGLALVAVFGGAAFATHETEATFEGTMAQMTGNRHIENGRMFYTDVQLVVEADALGNDVGRFRLNDEQLDMLQKAEAKSSQPVAVTYRASNWEKFMTDQPRRGTLVTGRAVQLQLK